MTEGKSRLKYVLAVFIYGTIGLMVRYIALPTEVIVLCRGVIGSAFILIYQRLRGQRPDWAAIRANLPLLAASGVCLGLNWVFLFAAYRHTTVAVASLCNYMAPIIVLLLAPVLLRERLTLRKGLCVATAFLGIVLVSGVLTTPPEALNLTGLLLGFAAALGFVGVVLCNKKLGAVSAYDRSLIQLAASALTVLPYVLLNNRGADLRPDALSLVLVLVLGVVHTGAAYCLYFGAMGALPVQSIAILGYIEPVVSVLSSALILRETLTPLGVLGAALIIGAAIVSELSETRTANAAAS